MEAAVVMLAALLAYAVVVIIAAMHGALYWRDKYLSEKKEHGHTRRQLYSAREDAYWWREIAKENEKEAAKHGWTSRRKAG